MNRLALYELLDANATYRSAHARSVPASPAPSRRLAILTCMDSRIDPLRVLGLQVGDAHILRNAGGRASADALRSLIVSTHVLGKREIGVVHHTGCGLEGTTDERLAERTGAQGVAFLAFQSTTQSVMDDVTTIRQCEHIAEGVGVWGAVFDVATGALDLVVTP